MLRIGLTCLLLTFAATVFADGPRDNNADSVRQVPPPGIELDADVHQEFTTQTESLAKKLSELQSLKMKDRDKLLIDIEIFHRAANQALRFNELFKQNDVKSLEAVLAEGHQRADELAKMNPYWLRQTGLVVRGFRSDIDGTVQPYGLEVPETYKFDGEKAHRCDLWFHGRGETVVETQFIAQRMSRPGQYPLKYGFVLHPFGRYSNAFKFAGEVDVLEALAHAKENYRIDEDRISVRGFSMGGAGCWQMAMHYSNMFFAANPGAGFSETPEFLKFFQGETLTAPDYERKLWNLYDAPGWCVNIHQIPTIAYSGEIDRQKQAADIMAAACIENGIQLTHIIGPQTAHKIHPESNAIIAKKMESLAKAGRSKFPDHVTFQTYTLKYNRMNWITINAIKEHWKPSGITGEVKMLTGGGGGGYGTTKYLRPGPLQINVHNVTDFTVNFPAGKSPFPLSVPTEISIGGRKVEGDFRSETDRSFQYRFRKSTAVPINSARLLPPEWVSVKLLDSEDDAQKLRKRHNMQGPIDDAFMSSFVFVKPTGEEPNAVVKKWVDSEFDHAVTHWRQQMRGDARVKEDTDINEEDIAQHNLILWGSPRSNSVYAKIADQLPIKWTEDGITVNGKTYPKDHAPILIYPNPLNREKYVVINSSFTYREYDYLNNARQTPKLPDWAIIDLKTPPNSRYPGKVVDADFFSERWTLKRIIPKL